MGNLTPSTCPIPHSVDVVVIGGGIVGVSTAWYLAQHNVTVALCEKAEIACEQSSRNWGFIRKQGRHPSEIPLMIESLERWRELVPQLDREIGFHEGGTLYLSDSDARYQSNLAWLEHAKSFQLDTRFLSPGELKSLIPDIRDPARGALFTPSDASAEPHLATSAIAEKARSAGAQILTHCAVRGIDMEAGEVNGVVTEHGLIRASRVICAGGAWSGYFCRNLGIVFPHLKVIGSVMATEATDFITPQSIWSSGCGLRRRLDGGYNVACGGHSNCDITPDFLRFFMKFYPAYRQSKEQILPRIGKRFFEELKWPTKWSLDSVTPFETERILNPQPDLKLLNQAHRLLGELLPPLKGIGIRQRWAGMIDVTPDELPIISTVARTPGLIISTGYSGHGFGIGPGAGKVTAELAMDIKPCVDLSAFSLDRFM